MIRLAFVVFMSYFHTSSYAQNLVTNGDFEEIECPTNEINSITETSTWYSLSADAYWLHLACPFDQEVAKSIVGLNKPIRAYRGAGHIYLEGGLSKSGFLISEGVGVELKELLKANHYYYFEMASLHCYEIQGPDYPDSTCQHPSDRFMSVIFSDKKISTAFEYVTTLEGPVTSNVEIDGTERLVDLTPLDPDFEFNEWNYYWDCFQADGNEKHIAISGSARQSKVSNNCFEEEGYGYLYFFGYAIDAVQLVQIPDKIDTTLMMCPDGIQINLEDFVPGPFFDKASFVWADGSTNIQRFLSDQGLYNVEMILPCVTVPISLDIQEVSCTADLYVANTFTPNNDGINDLLIPGFVAFFPVLSFNFRIYNRWGQLIYSSYSPEEGWDGKYLQQNSDTAVYTWMVEYVLDDGKEKIHRQTGDVLLINN